MIPMSSVFMTGNSTIIPIGTFFPPPLQAHLDMLFHLFAYLEK
jgi:hypothetical protein